MVTCPIHLKKEVLGQKQLSEAEECIFKISIDLVWLSIVLTEYSESSEPYFLLTLQFVFISNVLINQMQTHDKRIPHVNVRQKKHPFMSHYGRLAYDHSFMHVENYIRKSILLTDMNLTHTMIGAEMNNCIYTKAQGIFTHPCHN